MAAALVVTPTEVQVGDQVVITGSGFLPTAPVTVTITEYGEKFQTLSNENGDISGDDLPEQAFAVLTSSGVDVSVNDTVTIGAVTYTFKAAPTTVANEVKIGGTAALSLANLKNAINQTGVSGTDYGSSTVIHPTVSAGALTATTLRLYAKVGGTGGNALAFSKVAVTLSVSGANFSGGVASTNLSSLVFSPPRNTPFTVTATDGTNTATATVRVFSQ